VDTNARNGILQNERKRRLFLVFQKENKKIKKNNDPAFVSIYTNECIIIS
jgi:hypothetical protein